MTAYLLTEAQHAQIVDALSTRDVRLHEAALEMLKAMKPVEPCAFVQIEHLQEMQRQAEKYGYWHTIIASTHKNVPDNTPLYALGDTE